MSWFDAASETATIKQFEPLPPGTYQACITDIIAKLDVNNNEYIKVDFETAKGKVIDFLYLQSPYEEKERNGRAKLKLLCQIKGIQSLGGPSDLANFVGMECQIVVGQYTQKKEGFLPIIRNNVKDIKPCSEITSAPL